MYYKIGSYNKLIILMQPIHCPIEYLHNSLFTSCYFTSFKQLNILLYYLFKNQQTPLPFLPKASERSTLKTLPKMLHVTIPLIFSIINLLFVYEPKLSMLSFSLTNLFFLLINVRFMHNIVTHFWQIQHSIQVCKKCSIKHGC